jgi:hypothetical protein
LRWHLFANADPTPIDDNLDPVSIARKLPVAGAKIRCVPRIMATNEPVLVDLSNFAVGEPLALYGRQDQRIQAINKQIVTIVW